jgi:lactose/L-arabinose transport system permease protein
VKLKLRSKKCQDMGNCLAAQVDSLLLVKVGGSQVDGSKKKLTLAKKHNLTGWTFLSPAVMLIVAMSFVPMVQAFMLSLKTGVGAKIRWTGFTNYARMFQDTVFRQSLKNNFIYLIIQVPIMLVLALVLASMLNNKDLKFKGLFRTAIFLPCATSLVSYAIIFRSLFAVDGFINTSLINLGILETGYNFLGHATSARIVIILALVWRWTGYNMVFYLAGLQNIDYSVYEAAKIDGASPLQTFRKITVPLLKPTILLTTIMSTNGTLQLFDESVNLTNGGPANATITMSHYIYNTSFKYVPNFGYSAAMSYLILILVAVLAFIQMKVGDKRD